MPQITVQNKSIHYRTADKSLQNNIPMLFVHGAGSSLHVWSNQLQADIQGCYQIALDLPGHARSQATGQEYIQDYAQWIVDFIQAMDLQKCVLVGHSMGGAITQIIALSRPELLQGIALVGTGARLRVAQDILDRAWIGESFAEYAYAPQTSLELQKEAEKEFELTSPEVRYYDFLACDRFDIMDRIQDIQVPALIICGEEDRLTPFKFSRYLHEHLPNSRLELIPKAGHMVMWEQAERMNKILVDFLNS